MHLGVLIHVFVLVEEERDVRVAYEKEEGQSKNPCSRHRESGGCVVMEILVQHEERSRVNEEKWWKVDEQERNWI